MDAQNEKCEQKIQLLEKKLENSRKKISELEQTSLNLQQQLDAVKKFTDKSMIEKSTSFALSYLEVFGSKSDLEKIVSKKSVDAGERLDEKDAQPTCILTSKYPKIRVELRIKLQIEAEALVRFGDSKSATNLFRTLVQNVFPDASFWTKNTQKNIYKENADMIDAIISKCFNLKCSILSKSI